VWFRQPDRFNLGQTVNKFTAQQCVALLYFQQELDEDAARHVELPIALAQCIQV
jgi:hypothetical protein